MAPNRLPVINKGILHQTTTNHSTVSVNNSVINKGILHQTTTDKMGTQAIRKVINKGILHQTTTLYADVKCKGW